MATLVDDLGGVPRLGRGWAADQGFFTRFQIALVALILFGFLQFELRGFVDIRTAPAFLHVHGAVMVSWLGLTIAQNLLVGRGQLQAHRVLGWTGVALAVAVVVMASYTGRAAIMMGIVPPFFSTPQFLALTQMAAILFGLTVGMAIVRREETQWHRRLMLGSTILIVEPAFGRLLPMPLMGGWGEWVILAIQLGMFAVLARHDRRVLGAIHPATAVGAAVVVTHHVATSALAMFPPWIAYAATLAAA
jgi:hypothetical protein